MSKYAYCCYILSLCKLYGIDCNLFTIFLSNWYKIAPSVLYTNKNNYINLILFKTVLKLFKRAVSNFQKRPKTV